MQYLPASIEISPSQALTSETLPGAFPLGTRVYITDVGTHSTQDMALATKRTTDLGYHAVPHVAARRLQNRADFSEKLKAYTQTGGATDILIIGGSPDKQVGDISSTMDVLETGLIDENNIAHVGIAGHPEGSPDFSDLVAKQSLSAKQAFANTSDAEFRIVTQFGFDAAGFIRWADGLPMNGSDLPVHLGVAGPAKLTTLIKFAAMCGVGNSMQFLRKNVGKLTALATTHSPEGVVGPLEQHVQENPDSSIKCLHVFPFGGMMKSAEWLHNRGSWVQQTAAASGSISAS